MDTRPLSIGQVRRGLRFLDDGRADNFIARRQSGAPPTLGGYLTAGLVF